MRTIFNCKYNGPYLKQIDIFQHTNKHTNKMIYIFLLILVKAKLLEMK